MGKGGNKRVKGESWFSTQDVVNTFNSEMLSYSFTGFWNGRCTDYSLKCVLCLKQYEMVKFFPLKKSL